MLISLHNVRNIMKRCASTPTAGRKTPMFVFDQFRPFYQQRSVETGEGCSQAVWSMNYSPPVSGQVAHITANHHVDNVLGNIGSMIANAFQIFCY